MKPTQRYFLKVFLLTGISFGAIQFFFNYWLGNDTPLIGLIIQGVLFGLLFSFFAVQMQKKKLKQMGRSINSEADLVPSQQDELMVQEEIDVVWRALVERFAKQKGWKLKEKMPAKGKLILTRGTSMWSWGEKIEIRLRDLNEGYTLVQVNSSPMLSTTLIDYGRNRENVEQVLAFVEKVAPRVQNTDIEDSESDSNFSAE